MAAPLLIPVLVGVLVSVAKPILSIIIRMLGFGLVAYVGFDLAFTELKNLVDTHYGAMPSALLAVLDLMGVDSAIQNLFATMAGIVAFKSFTASVQTVWRKPGASGPITKEF